MMKSYKVMLTDNVEAHIEEGRFGCAVAIAGGHNVHAAYGWALVLGDRLSARNVEVRCQAQDNQAVLTVNGCSFEVVKACLKEIE